MKKGIIFCLFVPVMFHASEHGSASVFQRSLRSLDLSFDASLTESGSDDASLTESESEGLSEKRNRSRAVARLCQEIMKAIRKKNFNQKDLNTLCLKVIHLYRFYAQYMDSYDFVFLKRGTFQQGYEVINEHLIQPLRDIADQRGLYCSVNLRLKRPVVVQ